ncbi:PREDICTED: leucine-rich single-pass membrane protein 2 [Crocodylus porosus]|uniref:leucine-rich single-pass membrane protein 2 n=1 Tax=Crocodylus porosus TaxID=8502 RepID=UPI00094060BF|nr:PREDICTED: leucine-rich single-pass membrane protein 2 [Crocodylus porosus]
MTREAGEADRVATAAAALDGEPLSLSGNDLADIDLHPVESISDLYWASGGHEGHKGTEGNDPSLPNAPRALHTHPARYITPHHGLLPMLRPIRPDPVCPCFSPICCRRALFTFLGMLVMGSLILATLAVYLSVLQSESLRILSQWLTSQEQSVRQMRATSLQLWSRLNATEPGAQT